MIDRYLERGEMYVLYDAGEVRAVCVVTQENDQILELKNLAVKPQCQRRGYEMCIRDRRSLIENYANHSHKPGEALLLHGVYSWHSGKGIDVGNIWGDYYYVEALVRFLKDWKVWW